MSQDERDPSVDAVWPHASHEEPSRALDDAIRAAARHSAAAPPGSRRGKHWWYPLAAAATVAVLAVGIAQLTPPERVGPTANDMPAAPEQRPPAAPSAAAKDAAKEAPPAPAPPEAPPTPTAPAREAGTAASAPPAKGPQRPASAAAVIERSAPEFATNSPPAAPPPAPARVARSASEPFPAVTAPPPSRERTLEEASPAAQVAAESVKAPNRVAAARAATGDTANQASARSVDDWIKRIRELKNAGRLDEAARELAAFRSAYGERADALLPPDLRRAPP